MRSTVFIFIGLLLILLLTSCANGSKTNSAKDLAAHCPVFGSSKWNRTEISQPQKEHLINKQEFAIPNGYKTLWFKSSAKSKASSVALCIIPDQRNRGTNYGCGSAYAVYLKKDKHWQLKDQKVTICSD